MNYRLSLSALRRAKRRESALASVPGAGHGRVYRNAEASAKRMLRQVVDAEAYEWSALGQ